MARIFLLNFLLLPFLGFSQCSVNLGNDILQCNGNPVTLTAIHTGTNGQDLLKITFDASIGQSTLVGASEVYMHSGIQTTPFGPWEYVVGNWGLDDGLGEMTSVGNNIWEISINVPSYYGYPGGTNVIGLWMVFRNGNGSSQAGDGSGNDIFVETSNGNLSTFSGVSALNVAGSTGTFSWNTGAQTESITVTQTGTYSITFTDGVGCVSTDDVFVQFGTGNVQVNLGPDLVLCDGETVVLDAGAGFASYTWSTSETSQTLEVGLPGDYSVTVTNQQGCTGIDLIHIETGTAPTADFSYSAVTGTTMSFTDLGSDATIIYWDFDGDGEPDDSCAAGGTVQYTFPSESVFGVEMTAVNGCGEDVTTQNVLVQDVGIEQLKALLGFSYYPNPVTEAVMVGVENPSTFLDWIMVLDLSGREMINDLSVNQTKHSIDLSQLPSSVYVLRVSTNKGIINERIVKQ